MSDDNHQYGIFYGATITGCGLFLVAILLFFIPYKQSVDSYHTDKCNILECNAFYKYCSQCATCQKFVCVEVNAKLQLVNTNYVNNVQYTYNIYNGYKINNNISCNEIIYKYSNPIKCYYDETNLPDSLKFIQNNHAGTDILFHVIIILQSCGFVLMLFSCIYLYKYLFKKFMNNVTNL